MAMAKSPPIWPRPALSVGYYECATMGITCMSTAARDDFPVDDDDDGNHRNFSAAQKAQEIERAGVVGIKDRNWSTSLPAIDNLQSTASRQIAKLIKF